MLATKLDEAEGIPETYNRGVQSFRSSWQCNVIGCWPRIP